MNLMEKDRVKYYSRSDGLYFHMLKMSLEKIKVFDENKEDYSLEDIIELYNIVKYIEDDAKFLLETEEDKRLLDKKTKYKLMKPIGSFFNGVNESNILNLSLDCFYGYAENYLELFEKFQVFNRVIYEVFSKSLNNLKINEHYIYQYKKIVHHYDKQLKNHLLEDENAFNLLLQKYLSTEIKKELFLPTSLSKNDKETITINYIKSKCAHINILEIIVSLPVFDDFCISDETRVLAKDRYDELVKEYHDEKKGAGIKTGIYVGFSDELEEDFISKYENNEINLTINKNWISENLDYPTLLNNLIHVLELTDLQMRFNGISKPNNMHTVTRIFVEKKLKNYYLFDYGIEVVNKLYQLAFAAYREYLQLTHNIRLEEIIQWFFDTYLPEEFSLNDFSVNMPSKDSTYLEKCRTICCEIESLLKQYDSLVKYGKVRHDIIEISSLPILIEDVRSFIKEKYVYIKTDNCSAVLFWLFSDQTLLTYFGKNKKGEEYDNFFELLINEKVNIDEYEEHQKTSLNCLLNERIIKLDDKGDLFFSNVKEVILLHDLYINEYVSYNYYKEMGYGDLIIELLKKDWITIDSSLLSVQECSYLEFYLNKRKYFNGYDFRNTYLHGTQRKNGQDIELHKFNYNVLLMLYVLLVIKINDDLCQHLLQ